jgi:voltage-gated potassium channel
MAVSAERLRSVPLFSTLSEDELTRLGEAFEEKRSSSGTHVTLEGASGYSFFVIESGTVEVDRSGEVLKTLGPGDFFGETAILTGERRNATITASTDVELLVLFGTEFRRLESELPAAAEEIRQKMAERAAETPR